MKKIYLLSVVLWLLSLSAFGQQANRITALRDTLCQGTTGSITLHNNTDTIIQWQSSPPYGNFTDIPGADSTFYLTKPVLATTWFRAVVGKGSSSAYSDTIELIVTPPITVIFTYSDNGSHSFTFNSTTSGNIVRYFWDFGDGDTSNLVNPVHNYKLDTIYITCLTIYDGFNCNYTYCRDVERFEYQGGGGNQNPGGGNPIGVPTLLAKNIWAIYPNPFSKALTVTAKQQNNPMQTIIMYNLLGQQVYFNNTQNLRTTSYHLPMPNLSSGMYYLIIKTATASYVQKVLRQ